MDYKFENRYYDNDEMIKEYISKIITGKISLVGMGTFIFSLIFSVIMYKTNDYVLMAIVGTAGLISFVAAIFTPILTFKEIKKSSKALNSENHENIVRFGNDITIEQGKAKITVEYNKIFKTHNLKHSYVLQFGKQNSILIVPDKFTKGNFEEFKIFLKEKCPELEIN